MISERQGDYSYISTKPHEFAVYIGRIGDCMVMEKTFGQFSMSGFSYLDRRLAAFVNRLAMDRSEYLCLAVALASYYAGRGHTCVDLARHAGAAASAEFFGDGAEFVWPQLDVWLRHLKLSGVVGEPGDHAPLVLSGTRLYLQRFFKFESQVFGFLLARSRFPAPDLNFEVIRQGLLRLFPPGSDGDEVNWQRIAALTAVTGRIAIITGGPGTGKTSTVAAILALLLEQTANPAALRIALSAPTGKAVTRLQEAIKAGQMRLDCSEAIRSAMPNRATTLHRLLGAGGQGRPYLFNEFNQLPVDLVVVDEASMVDLPLMARLVRALPEHCRLILLGDRDQLASVEPGSVLGDICGPAMVNSFSDDFIALSSSIAGQKIVSDRSSVSRGFHDSVVELRWSWRFSEQSGISVLSRAVKSGDVEAVSALFARSGLPDVVWRELPSQTAVAEELMVKILPWAHRLSQSGSVEDALALLGEQGILCALRQGPWGVETINRLLETLLARQGLKENDCPYYPGRPIIITENSYRLQLFNGDVGVVLPSLQAVKGLRGFFQAAGGGVRSVPLVGLPAHESAFALTVHKSQGSEFRHVLLILPDAISPVLCRELIYTALTRARESIEVWGRWSIFAEALQARIERQSGLRDRLLLSENHLIGNRSEV